MFDGMDDEDAALMDDGTMVFGEDELREDIPPPFNANLVKSLISLIWAESILT